MALTFVDNNFHQPYILFATHVFFWIYAKPSTGSLCLKKELEKNELFQVRFVSNFVTILCDSIGMSVFVLLRLCELIYL